MSPLKDYLPVILKPQGYKEIGLFNSSNSKYAIYMQYAPYKLKTGDWESQRIALGETVVKTPRTCRP